MNANYAVTVGLCAMGMDHNDECCCVQSTSGKESSNANECKDVSLTKEDCCNEFTTEYTNTADLNLQKKLENENRFLLFIVSPSIYLNFSLKNTITSCSSNEYLFIPPDIPILHSSLLI